MYFPNFMKICPQLFENFQVNLLTNREANTDLNTTSVNLRRDSRPRKQVNLMISGFISVTTRAGIQFDILLFIYTQIPSVVTSRQISELKSPLEFSLLWSRSRFFKKWDCSAVGKVIGLVRMRVVQVQCASICIFIALNMHDFLQTRTAFSHWQWLPRHVKRYGISCVAVLAFFCWN